MEDFVGYLRANLSCNWAIAAGTVLCGIGLFHVTNFIYAVGRFFFRVLLPPINFKRFGQWVVVTGATDGIGKAYCTEFAKRGLNVCLLSRTEAKLLEVAEALKGKYGVETKYVTVDFAHVSSEKWEEIQKLMTELEVGILVNNVGCSYEHYEYFHLIDDATISCLIEVNIRATIQMTRAVLPEMLKRRKGVVINVGSGAGSLLPSNPLLAVYAGSKSFVEQFTKSCCVEYRDKGILFQDQAPLFVATKMSKIRRASLTAPSPEVWAKSAIQQVGNGALTSGYWIHNVIWAVMTALPPSLLDAYVLSTSQKMRSKALKKKATAAKKD